MWSKVVRIDGVCMCYASICINLPFRLIWAFLIQRKIYTKYNSLENINDVAFEYLKFHPRFGSSHFVLSSFKAVVPSVWWVIGLLFIFGMSFKKYHFYFLQQPLFILHNFSKFTIHVFFHLIAFCRWLGLYGY